MIPAKDARALHWVLKVADRTETVKFFREVLGLEALRHEEFEAGPTPLERDPCLKWAIERACSSTSGGLQGLLQRALRRKVEQDHDGLRG